MLKRILIISAVLLSITSCDNKQNNKTVVNNTPKKQVVKVPGFNADSA
jgi:uncharacterized lipoprotein NlpE involved in copper resistance